MKKEEPRINRRGFFKSAGIAGLSGIVASTLVKAGDVNVPDINNADANKPDANKPKVESVPASSEPEKIPTRKLGRTGAEVPVLSLGLGRPVDSVVLTKALDWGVYHWDASFVAGGGNSETSIGAFLAKNLGRRKEIFIVSKAWGTFTGEDIEKCLQTSLRRMNTTYIDLYCGVYMVNKPAQLTEDVRKWAQDAKKRGVIKYFGFSTHENMAACLMAASKLDWIDAIQTTYNFRLMQDSAMQEAVEACHKAGIGLIAMKTQAKRPRGPVNEEEAEADKKMVAHFTEKGFTEGQAKIKMVLDDKRISTVCSNMGTVSMLMTNVAAVLDKTSLTAEDRNVLERYASQTCAGYCAGCSDICGPLAAGAPVSDIMRALMYHNSYGDKAGAKQVFAQIPAEIRRRLLKVDYRTAEARCPNRMPIGKCIADADSLLNEKSA